MSAQVPYHADSLGIKNPDSGLLGKKLPNLVCPTVHVGEGFLFKGFRALVKNLFCRIESSEGHRSSSYRNYAFIQVPFTTHKP